MTQQQLPQMVAAMTADQLAELMASVLSAHRPDDVLTAAEAAAYLKLHVDHVTRLAQQGKLPAAKLGREWRFVRSDLTAYVRGEAM